MAYSPILWKNKEESAVSPLNANNLNHMDNGIQQVDAEVEIIKTQIAGVLDPENIVKSWTMNPTTGLITVEWADGRIQRYDLNIEKIPVDFKMSPDGVITMRTADGTEYTADLKEYIKPYKFTDSDQLAVNEDGNNVTFSVKTHSILPEMLEPDFLADCVTAKTEAEGFADTAATKAKDSADSAILSESYAVGGTGTRPGEDADNAKYYYEQTKAVSHVEKASTDKMGIVKIPTDGTITIDPDGTIHGNASITVDTVLDKTSTNAIANGAVATAIEDIETDITGINTDIGNINTEIGGINTDIDNITSDIDNLNTDLAQLSDEVNTSKENGYIDGGKNLFNPNKIISNHTYNASTGILETNQTISCIDKIKVESGSYYFSGVNMAFRLYRWSENAYLSTEIITLPCAIDVVDGYIAINFVSTADLSKLQIERGNSATSFQPYAKSNVELTEEVESLSNKSDSVMCSSGGTSKTIVFSQYQTSALITCGNSIHIFSNGYLFTAKADTAVSVSLSSDYKTITVKNNSANNYYVGVMEFGNVGFEIK